MPCVVCPRQHFCVALFQPKRFPADVQVPLQSQRTGQYTLEVVLAHVSIPVIPRHTFYTSVRELLARVVVL